MSPADGGFDARIVEEPVDASTIDSVLIEEPDAQQAPDARVDDAAPPVGAISKYVTSAIDVPTTSVETRNLALDLDGDANQRPDNALGGIFAALAQQGIDIQADHDAAVAAGRLVMLHQVQAENLTGGAAWWSVFHGADQENPDFSGAGSFSLEPGAPTDSLLEGQIVGGVFTGGPGRARVELQLFGVPVVMDLVGARVSAEITATSCAGKLGGAISTETINAQVFPALASGLSAILAADPGCPTQCTGQAATVSNLFDTNHDGAITVEEISGNALMQALFAPDLDLLDGSGAFNPLQDQVRESLSLGVGITCVGASFTP